MQCATASISEAPDGSSAATPAAVRHTQMITTRLACVRVPPTTSVVTPETVSNPALMYGMP